MVETTGDVLLIVDLASQHDIPSLSGWGLIALAAALASTALSAIRNFR